MTLGEKLKLSRNRMGLSQEVLAQKLRVSRSAVAKWETDKGIPDVENLKALAELLGVSVDYLLSEGDGACKHILKESVDLSLYAGKGTREKKDTVVKEKFPDADIVPLIAREKLTKGQRIFDNLLGIFTDAPFGTADVFNEIKNCKDQYYLAQRGDRQFLVLITDEFIESRELPQKLEKDKFEFGNMKFIKCKYGVK
ncbi:MAG: helix-turn-helix transcriptional regulator [Ruminococcus sp.]|nr:helix-turn-helix transcriptional regulator [Ruminococcus sp.]